MTDITHLQALTNLHDGDVLWVVTRADMEPEEQDAVRDVLCSSITQDVTIICTPAGFIETMHQQRLDTLLALKDAVDAAIQHVALHQPVDEV